MTLDPVKDATKLRRKLHQQRKDAAIWKNIMNYQDGKGKERKLARDGSPVPTLPPHQLKRTSELPRAS